MPVWLTEHEYAMLRAACAQLLPSDQGAPGAEEAGVADYIDILLGAFTFDPPRIWAGGPSSGRAGGAAGFGTFHRLTPLDELAWRMRIEGSQGLPEREFNGPVVGLQEIYRRGPGRARGRLLRGRRSGAAPTAAGRRGFCDHAVRSTAAKGCTAPPNTGATGTASGGPTSIRRRRPAPGLQRRRGVGAVTVDAIIIGSGPGGSTAADVLTRAGWSVVIMEKGRNHLLDPDDPTKPAADYSNDEIKFIARHFLGPDPLIEPRAFRRSEEDGEHTYVGEVNSIPSTVGGGGTHADGKVPRFREEDFRVCRRPTAPKTTPPWPTGR